MKKVFKKVEKKFLKKWKKVFEKVQKKFFMKKIKKLCPICATVLFFLKVMSHLRHRQPRGPIFIDGSIVTKVH